MAIPGQLEEGDLIHFRFGCNAYGYGRVKWVSGSTVALRAVDARDISIHANEIGAMRPILEPGYCVPLWAVKKWDVGR